MSAADENRDADRTEIADGLHHYCYWVDRNRPDRQVEIFTTDCEVVFRKDRIIVGLEKVEAILWAGLEKYAATHHHLSNITIDFDGNSAAVRSYVYAWHRHVDPAEADMHLFGEYHDTWRHTPAGWRCASRTLLAAGTIPARQDLDGIGRES